MQPLSIEQFAQIVRAHQSTVCAAAYGVTGDRALAEDVAQETFVAAWRSLAKLGDPNKPRSWLRGIARNLAHKATRRRRATVELDEQLGGPASEPVSERERAIYSTQLVSSPLT